MKFILAIFFSTIAGINSYAQRGYFNFADSTDLSDLSFSERYDADSNLMVIQFKKNKIRYLSPLRNVRQFSIKRININYTGKTKNK